MMWMPLAAAPVGGEDDAGAVRAETRLSVEGHALGEGRRGAAGDGHGVEIAEEIEDEGLAVGAHVDRHPGAFGEAGGDGAAGGKGEAFLAGVGGGVGGFLGEEGGGGGGEGGRGECRQRREGAKARVARASPR